MVSMWGQYFTLKYPNMSNLESFLKAIPFAWLDWFFMTIAIGIGDKHNLVTPTQDTFLLIIVQFITVLLINTFWLRQPLHRSDIVTFFIILTGFYISFNNTVSKLLGRPIAKLPENKNKDNKSFHDLSSSDHAHKLDMEPIDHRAVKDEINSNSII